MQNRTLTDKTVTNKDVFIRMMERILTDKEDKKPHQVLK